MPKKTKNTKQKCPCCGHEFHPKEPVSKTVGFHIRMLEEQIADDVEASEPDALDGIGGIPEKFL